MEHVTKQTDVRSDALRLLSNGLYILTCSAEEMAHGAAISWVTQVSFRPPLIMMALQRNSHLAHAVRTSRRFALNILASDQTELAERFLQHLIEEAGGDSLGGYAARPSPARCPLLRDALAWLECRVAGELESPGDHTPFLGEVIAAGLRKEETPLTLWMTPWNYGGLR